MYIYRECPVKYNLFDQTSMILSHSLRLSDNSIFILLSLFSLTLYISLSTFFHFLSLSLFISFFLSLCPSLFLYLSLHISLSFPLNITLYLYLYLFLPFPFHSFSFSRSLNFSFSLSFELSNKFLSQAVNLILAFLSFVTCLQLLWPQKETKYFFHLLFSIKRPTAGRDNKKGNRNFSLTFFHINHWSLVWPPQSWKIQSLFLFHSKMFHYHLNP